MRKCKLGSGLSAERMVVIVILLVALRGEPGVPHHSCRVLRYAEMQLVGRLRSLEDCQGFLLIVCDSGSVMAANLRYICKCLHKFLQRPCRNAPAIV